MFVAILAGVLLLMALGAGLAGWRAKKLQSSDTFGPTDHVEVTRGGFQMGGITRGGMTGGSMILPREIHHDDDEPTFQPGD